MNFDNITPRKALEIMHAELGTLHRTREAHLILSRCAVVLEQALDEAERKETEQKELDNA